LKPGAFPYYYLQLNEKKKEGVHLNKILISLMFKCLQTVTTSGAPRQANGGIPTDSTPGNGYPVPTSSSGHSSALGSLTGLNGIGGAQSTGYEAK
jgi:hypothetical protein